MPHIWKKKKKKKDEEGESPEKEKGIKAIKKEKDVEPDKERPAEPEKPDTKPGEVKVEPGTGTGGDVAQMEQPTAIKVEETDQEQQIKTEKDGEEEIYWGFKLDRRRQARPEECMEDDAVSF